MLRLLSERGSIRFGSQKPPDDKPRIPDPVDPPPEPQGPVSEGGVAEEKTVCINTVLSTEFSRVDSHDEGIVVPIISTGRLSSCVGSTRNCNLIRSSIRFITCSNIPSVPFQVDLRGLFVHRGLHPATLHDGSRLVCPVRMIPPPNVTVFSAATMSKAPVAWTTWTHWEPPESTLVYSDTVDHELCAGMKPLEYVSDIMKSVTQFAMIDSVLYAHIKEADGEEESIASRIVRDTQEIEVSSSGDGTLFVTPRDLAYAIIKFRVETHRVSKTVDRSTKSDTAFVRVNWPIIPEKKSSLSPSDTKMSITVVLEEEFVITNPVFIMESGRSVGDITERMTGDAMREFEDVNTGRQATKDQFLEIMIEFFTRFSEKLYSKIAVRPKRPEDTESSQQEDSTGPQVRVELGRFRSSVVSRSTARSVGGSVLK